jgi:cytochrome c551/c552
MKRFSNLFLLFAFALAASPHLMAAVVKIDLPPETFVFKPGPNAELANGQCLVCHSVEYVTMQPRLPRTFWTASVKKMREKYGAPVPDDQVAPLVDYLTRNYGAETNGGSASTTPVAANSASQTAATGEALATKYGCLGCHNPTSKIVGPPYKDVAAKYVHDAEAFAKVSEQIHKGGSGKWGPIIMPPFPMISEAETKALADWILSRK